MKKRILSVVMIATMLCTLFGVPAMAKDFTDSSGHWAAEAISVWSDRGVVNGDDAGNFRPGDPITRAETAKMMDNLIGYQKASIKVFSDVAADDWFAQSVSRLYEAGVMTGYEDGTIRPGAPISRQEAAVMIGRAFDLDTANVNTGVLTQFSDNGQIQSWASPIVAFMAERNFIQGSDGMFRPGDPITRAEIVTILNNMVAVYADGSKSYFNGTYGDKIAIVKAPTTFDGVVLGGAVICPAVEGSVNFNSNSYINGRLCVLSADATVGIIGATVASTSNKYGGIINNSSYSTGYNTNYNSTPSMGGGGGAGGSSSSSTTKYNVAFYGNGGFWDDGESEIIVRCTSGKTYVFHLPNNPKRTGYTFKGWYVSEVAANNLTESKKLQSTDVVNSASVKELYAGWQKNSGRYGTLKAATGENIDHTGKSAAELMVGVEITEARNTDAFEATGALKYVTDYHTGPAIDGEGNFLAITYQLPSRVTNPVKSVLKIAFGDEEFPAYENFTAGNTTYTQIFEITEEMQDEKIVFTIDLNGDGKDKSSLSVDVSDLVLYSYKTVSTLEQFTAALADKAVEKITVDAGITLTDGSYAPVTGRKALVLEQPLLIEKDADVTLKNLDVAAAGALTSMVANATEIPEGETEAVATKAASLTLEGLTVDGDGFAKILDNVKAVALTAKNNELKGDAGKTNDGFFLMAPAEGDTVVIEGNIFDGFSSALAYADATALTTEGNALKKNQFLNNTVDIKIGIEKAEPGTIPNVAYNFFDHEPVVQGLAGALDAILYPTYTAATMEDSQLSENLHDAYVFADGVCKGKLSQLDSLALTFASEDAPLAIVVVPMDLRDTAVTINEEEIDTVSLLKSEMPTNLIIKIGDGAPKTVAVSEATPA
ncbi:MAG: S-layer homology domain-containing protein [Clostridia bacterium]|nr:S-layer homology domain-containing protein [Clostridia bacterium]